MSNDAHPNNAAVLIDLENFYLERERKFRESGLDEPYNFAEDLEKLSAFAADLAGARRRTVRRAYANFNVSRRSESDGQRWDYYLQKTAGTLMEQGIEPVQVFRFPGGGNKNAADMRLAMDASALMTGRSHLEFFVLVTGDADFIPLILELKKLGAEVAVIGVKGSTKLVLQRYCDQFEYFEDLVAAREVSGEGNAHFEEVRDALHRILLRRRPMVFAAVKPLMSRELGLPFDPDRFGCEDTGDFLRTHSDRLGLTVSKQEYDWEIDLAEGVAEPSERIVTLIPHSPNLYQNLLRNGYPRIYVVPGNDWERITEAIHQFVVDEEGQPRVIHHNEIVEDAIETCSQAGVEHAERKVNAVVFLLFKSGCFECAAEGADAGITDFHWSHAARIRADFSTLETLRRQGRLYIVSMLEQRLQAKQNTEDHVEPRLLAELLEGGEPDPARMQSIEELITQASSS